MLSMSVVSAILVLSRKERATMPRKPRMTRTEKNFSELLTGFLFVAPTGVAGQNKIDFERWEMLTPEVRNEYLKLIATKTR